MKTRFVSRLTAVLLLGLMISLAAYAAQTAIVAQTPKGPYPGTVTSGALDLVETVADNVNGNSFVMTGHEVLLIHNTDTIAQTVTITSVADVRGRSADVTAYSVAAGKISAFSFLGSTDGWAQTGGSVNFTASAATVKFTVLSVPR